MLSSGKPRPGVKNYLNDAKKLNLKIGLASSSTYSWVSQYLEVLGIKDRFECIKTSDDVEKVKPDAALYLEAAKCLGLAPEECIAFEDSANGSQAATQAGMKCVVVTNPLTETMTFSGIDHKMKSMEEMDLESVIKLVSK